MRRAGAESALIERARRGDRRALERLLAAEQPRVYAFGLRMCSNEDDAKEVLQETLWAVAKAVPSFRGEAALSTWIFQIARRACHRRRRKRGSTALEGLESAGAVPDPRPDPEALAGAREVSDAIAAALATLPPSAREVIVLRDVEGLTAPEVARTLGITVQAVKSRLHRARSALVEALEPAPVPRADGCPDIAALFSRDLEGELSATVCRRMESHVAECPECKSTCASLQRSLERCRELPAVPAHLEGTAYAAAAAAREVEGEPVARAPRAAPRVRGRPRGRPQKDRDG